MQKPRLSFWQIWNMSFGFLGIQFGWGLQLGNMSAIYERLGANPDRLPMLWLAAPLTGLIIQPIIGSMSDRTWGSLGRRRPYFLVGAILASVALFFMPTSSSLWMAAGLLWILDASINVSMEPFRAFIADKLNDEQRTSGFVMQSFFIGLGATFAGWLPLAFHRFGVTGNTASGIPLTIKYAFQIGAVSFLLAVIWTVATSKEYPPEDIAEFNRMRQQKGGFAAGLSEIFTALREMPQTMRQLAPVQICTWLGLFCMWLFYVPAVARHVFGALDPQSEAYTRGVEWGSFAMSFMNITCFGVAFLLPKLAAATSRKTVHAVCLIVGALGLLSVYAISQPWMLIVSMICVGIAWASILSMPYAILSGALPAARMGVYMGVFNFFIVIPEITQALTFGPLIRGVFGADNPRAPLYVVLIGGVFMFLAALLVTRVRDVHVDVPGAAVLRADEHEPFVPQQSAQPVPSTGLVDKGRR
ncbi:MAG: maltose/moltooligosaccharide transporter [Acidobacteriota bacterium]|jgi:maltose/moltooligosaccharide transporter|nr:maltose/moltooligosaccharide transporter [Acidobacteriota bacterium]